MNKVYILFLLSALFAFSCAKTAGQQTWLPKNQHQHHNASPHHNGK